MTDENIIKTLKRCTREGNCKGCPLCTKHSSDCIGRLNIEVIGLIKRLQNKIRKLETTKSPCDLCKHYQTSNTAINPCGVCPASRKRGVRK
ncbi:MAG: hypothetical protein ACI4JK_02170 [Oscillospiraceae bacterium]